MRRTFTKVLTAAALLICGGAMKAQTTVSQLSAYDTIMQTPDTLHWDISVMPTTGAFGMATLKVQYEGDFGDTGENITILGEDGSMMAVTRRNPDGNDCMPDSITITFNASVINTWSTDGVIHFTGVTSSQVDYFCDANHARVELDYSFCPLGPPIAMLASGVTNTCNSAAPIVLSASPAGGTLSGTGISGNSFDPSGLAPGTYPVTYTYTNMMGCTSNSTVVFTINDGPMGSASVDTVCPNGSALLSVSTNGHMVWYSDMNMTMPLDTGATFMTPPLTSTTSYYAATTLYSNYFMLDSISDNDSLTIDHDSITGDDRGGIAVTHNYVYMTGDNYTGRFTLDLDSAVALPRMDALFSDLATGKLYTLYNSVTGIADANMMDSVTITGLRTLNADLTLGTDSITLSDSIPFGWDNDYNYQSGIYAGAGFTIIYSAPRHTWYAIDLSDGVVTRLGMLENPEVYYSENWANWGVAEFDGAQYSVLYRDGNSNNMMRRVLPGGTPTLAHAYADPSDMASFTYAPWNNRLYLHYEGYGQFGGLNETLVYTYANDSMSTTHGIATFNCPAEVTVTVGTCTDVKEKVAGSMHIYPNPNNGVFTLQFSDNMANSKVEVISMEGRLVYSEVLKGVQNEKQIELNGLAKGVYYVRISNDVAVLTDKLVKY